MNTPPLVSIVMTTYNGTEFLKAQLDSIIAQTYPNIELIIVDDHSTDNTFEILKKYSNTYPNIRLFRNDSNIGYIRNFEKGIILASGKYIALSDQDDVWDVDKIKTMMCGWEHESIVYCNSQLIDEEGNNLNLKMSDIKKMATYHDHLPFLIGNCVSGHALIMRKNFALSVMPFPEECPHDWWLAFNASCADGVKFVNKTLVHYRQHSKSSIGMIKSKERKKTKPSNKQSILWMKNRMRTFADWAISKRVNDHEIVERLAVYYSSFSLINDYKRMMLFFQYRYRLTALKHRSKFRRWIFCFKMFFKLV